MARAEAEVAAGRLPARPVTLVSDPSVVDPGRIHAGLRPLWAYAHVPAGDTTDPTELITAQIERFAPGFRDVVVAARGIPPSRLGGTGWYLCSQATPPGPGVHGMSGWHAARRVLGKEFGIREMPDLSPGSS